jgi:hypothetical protein
MVGYGGYYGRAGSLDNLELNEVQMPMLCARAPKHRRNSSEVAGDGSVLGAPENQIPKPNAYASKMQ